MSKGNGIIVTPNPRGVFLEGYINAALKPGVIVQPDVSEGLGDDDRMDFEAFNRDADGNRPNGPLGILLPDDNQGQLATTAYASGARCFVYVPVAGEQFNCLVGDVAGTGDTHSFGELLIVDDGTGELIATAASPEIEPFMLMEAISTAPTADTLARVMYTGY